MKYNDPLDPNSELVIDDNPPHAAITVGELKQRELEKEKA